MSKHYFIKKNKMKQQLNEQFARMQKLAGIITENQVNEEDNMNDITADFKASPEYHSYEDVLGIIESWGDENALSDFKSKFPEGKKISKKDYAEFCYNYIDDMAETVYYKANWISLTDPSIFDKI